MAHKMAIPQQALPYAKNLAQTITPAAFSRQGFRQEKPNRQQQQRAISGKAKKYPAPTNQPQKRTADNGCDDRRHTHHQHQLRHQAHRAAFIRHIAHHGARDYHTGAATKRLHQPRSDQGFDIGCQGADKRRHRINAKPDE